MSTLKSRLSLSAIIRQLSETWKAILLGVAVSWGGAGVIVLVAALADTTLWSLAKDPAEVQRFPPYIGMLSNWDVVLWISTAAICLFGAVILKRGNAPVSTIRFLAVSGIFSLILGIDDLYMLHDFLLPRTLHVPEMLFYLLYLISFGVYLIYFTPQILKYDFLLFIVAIVFFVFSRKFFIRIPYFHNFNTTGDMLKYFGIVFWLIFFYRTTLREVIALFAVQKRSQVNMPDA